MTPEKLAKSGSEHGHQTAFFAYAAAAGTGIGLSVQGFASAGGAAAVGYVKASINGFEY